MGWQEKLALAFQKMFELRFYVIRSAGPYRYQDNKVKL